MLAYDYPHLGLFLTMLWLFLWVVWFFLIIRTVTDIFRSDDLSGVKKVLWLLFILALPYFGVFLYVLVRGAGMTRRELERAQAHEHAVREYVRDAAGGAGTADELDKLAGLRDRGVLTDTEFSQLKGRLLGA